MAVPGGQDRMLVNAVKSQPAVLNLNNKRLEKIPNIIAKIISIKSLSLKSNQLSDLGQELLSLKKLESLNLGNNAFVELPSVFQHLRSLLTLHLFNNYLERLPVKYLVGLKNLHCLNINNNRLKHLPPEINRLPYLEILSCDNNLLHHIPKEICHLSKLKELNLNNNCLKTLPSEIAFLQQLQKLCVHKNHLEDIPEGIGLCSKLQVLDLAGNMLQTFPVQVLPTSAFKVLIEILILNSAAIVLIKLSKLKLKEFYVEQNSLLQLAPIHSIQEPEVLALKEQAARFILTSLKDSASNMKTKIKRYPKVEEILSIASNCSHCGAPFLDTWLECVKFIDSKKAMRTRTNAGIIPIRGLLCSYECFNSEQHNYYGIAQNDEKMEDLRSAFTQSF